MPIRTSGARDKSYEDAWDFFHKSSPADFYRGSMEITSLFHGPEFPDQAFESIGSLTTWYGAVLSAWLTDSLTIGENLRGNLPAPENELALATLILEARNNGIRRIHRRIFRDRGGVPIEHQISTWSDLSKWCALMFEILRDDEQHVSHERQVLTFRYDKGVAYRNEKDRERLLAENDTWVAEMTSSMMRALCKGEPHVVKTDDDWLLVIWGHLAREESVLDATVSLFIDAETVPKEPHEIVIRDIVAFTWEHMRKLGQTCYAEPVAKVPSDARMHLDAVVNFCNDSGSKEECVIPKDSDELRYYSILKAIHAAGRAMERLPATYSGKVEEDLRDLFLVFLSREFPNATGESFNRKGKTDVLIREDGANVFVGECKFWKGPRHFAASLDQTLGNLTWRDTGAAVICFIRNKQLNPVLKQIANGLNEHRCCLQVKEVGCDSWFMATFHADGDPSREISIAVLCFHFP